MGEPLFSQIVIAFCAIIMAACVAMLYAQVRNNTNARRTAPETEEKGVSATAPVEAALTPTDDSALIAAISAALAVYLATDEKPGHPGFVVRRVRRIGGGSAWQRAGRDEQVYSRM